MSRKPLYATFSPSLVREYLDCFSGNDLKIMKYYYGIDAPKLKVEDISPILNMSINTIYRHLRRLSNSLEIMLQNNEKHTLSSRKKRVTKRIYTSKEIKPLLPYFSGNDLTILKMYYGIDESAKTLEEIEEVIKYDRSGIKKQGYNICDRRSINFC